MRIYLAGGMTVQNVLGRERELAIQLPKWHRLFSFHFKELIEKSEILEIAMDAQTGKLN